MEYWGWRFYYEFRLQSCGCKYQIILYFDNNIDNGVGGGYGLLVESMGNITLSGGRANNNHLFGED